MKRQKAKSLENITWSELKNKTYQLKRFIYPEGGGGGGGAKQDAGIPSTKKFVTPGLESILATDRNST